MSAARRPRTSTTSTASATHTLRRSVRAGAQLCRILLAFGSVAIALVSIALNLLSVGAAFRLLTPVFVHDIGTGLLAFGRVHTIEAWVPLFLFSVLLALARQWTTTRRPVALELGGLL
jgi:hypothetical protein